MLDVVSTAVPGGVAAWNGSASPVPKANEGLVKAKFYTEMANAKNAPALGIRVNAVVLLLGFLITLVKEECGRATFFGQ